MTSNTAVSPEVRTQRILRAISEETTMYTLLRKIVDQKLWRTQKQGEFLISLRSGLDKHGTLTRKQRDMLGETLRGFGDLIVEHYGTTAPTVEPDEDESEDSDLPF